MCHLAGCADGLGWARKVPWLFHLLLSHSSHDRQAVQCCLPPPDGKHLPDGATEQDWVLQNDGEPGPERVQRQFADVYPINHYPPCVKKHTEHLRELHKACDPQVAGGKVEQPLWADL